MKFLVFESGESKGKRRKKPDFESRLIFLPLTAKTIGKKSETDFYFYGRKLEKMRMREERLRRSRKQLNMELSKQYSGGKKHGEKEKTRRDNQCFR